MAKIERFEDLEIWKIAKSIAVDIYRLSELEPIKSDYGLKDQMRRASMSLSDNIAEGFEYNNNPDFVRYLNYAKGSCGELRSKLIILKECGKLNEQHYNDLYARTIDFSCKTKSFITYLRNFEMQKKLKK